MNDTMIVFFYIQQSQLRAATIFCRSSKAPTLQSFNNLIQLDIAYPQTLEWVKVLPIFYFTEALVSDQHAEKQNFSRDKSSPFGIQQEGAISTISWQKKGIAINPIYRCCL